MLTLSVVFPLCAGNVRAQSDTSRVAPKDSITYGWEQITTGWNWISKQVGGDLFITYEIYGFNLNTFSPPTSGGGPGIEIRVRPVFVGSYVGFCGNEGIQGPWGMFSFAAFYGGAIVHGYRLEVGEVLGDNTAWTEMEVPHQTYTSAFIGVSRRIGSYFFLEPDVKLMLPIVSHYSTGNTLEGFVPGVGHYHLRDLFFSIGLKLGIGAN